MIRENFPLEKLGIAQFVKIFPLENNPLYGSYIQSCKPDHFPQDGKSETKHTMYYYNGSYKLIFYATCTKLILIDRASKTKSCYRANIYY